ncbi:ABC transporter substrate-binding protein [Streptomyces sp. NPDC056716]|uniref:ABC transporter substrate-binding protein n=1 Tax=unclassified Streptomyces TaxID=2593676 RepID=UPI0036999FF5
MATAMALTACSGSNAKAPEPPGTGGAKSGGTLVVGEYSGVNSLDPMMNTGSVTIGGNETLAIYGTLIRWDSKKLEGVPYMAKSLEHNADHTQWTMKLRPGMVFSDGSPYDAAAVVMNLDRNRKSFFSIANSLSKIESVKATDDLTVVITMKKPDAQFPYVLSIGPGMIASPNYIKAVDGGNKTAPAVGAGPFVVSDFKPGSSLTLKPNPTHALDKPLLNTLTFQMAGTEKAQLQAFEAGQLQAGITLDSHSDIEIKQKKIPTIATRQTSGVALQLNNRKTSPLGDVRLRKAVQLAFNPKVWNERNNAGEEVASDLLFMKGSLFHSEDQQKIPYDPQQARQLVDQVKADTGWNGELDWVGPSTQTNQPVILSSMLNPIGITLKVTNLPVANFYTKVYVEHDYDIAGGGGAIADSTPAGSIHNNYVTPTNSLGYSNPEMVKISDEMAAAATLDERRVVMKKFLALYIETVPSISCGTTTWNFFHKPNVQGLQQVGGQMIQFDKAWMS